MLSSDFDINTDKWYILEGKQYASPLILPLGINTVYLSRLIHYLWVKSVMEIKTFMKGLWVFLQYPLGAIGVYQIARWLVLLTPVGKRFTFRWEINKLAHANRDLFWGHCSNSVSAYLIGSHVVVEGNILSDWWNYAFSATPTLFSQRNPEELVCLINSARNAIKKVKENSKQAQYQQMAHRFNSFCKELEDISKKSPDLCQGLSYLEKLPPM